MKVNGRPMRTIWPAADGRAVDIIDQTALPHRFEVRRLANLPEVVQAIRAMQVRGAPLIGATAAYGVALAMQEDAGDEALERACRQLAASRPTAVNLHWAIERLRSLLKPLAPAERPGAAWIEARHVADEDAAQNRRIGEHGLALLRDIASPRAGLRVMTHCNAGWLATVDHGTALAPVYAAHDAGLPVHVWVSETRPRNQGLLTAWELAQHGVPHTLVADNAAGWLLARGEVDAVIVGADRIAANGDVANKVGTYLKALAAKATGVPFWVAAPRSSLDFACPDGDGIPIEERDGDEMRRVAGLDAEGRPACVRIVAGDAPCANPAFDVTPAALVGALITERGTCAASADGLRGLYPEVRADG